MNWIKANKFLTGFMAVMVIGIGILAYFLSTASSAYDAAEENYQGKANELARLRHLPLYPNQKNLKKLEDQKEEAADMVSTFQAQLATRQFKGEDWSPAEFQDKLKAAVTDITAKAAAVNMALPKEGKFYLGFDPYESRPPEAEAVVPLSRQLKAIQWIVEKLIESKVKALVALNRTPLPEEKLSSGGAGGRRQDRAERGSKDLVTKVPLDLELTAGPGEFGRFLNEVVGPKAPQFFIPRVVRIKNSDPKGPARAAGAQPGVAPSPDAPAVVLGYIVGEEHLLASLRLEIVEFAAPGTKSGKAGKGKK